MKMPIGKVASDVGGLFPSLYGEGSPVMISEKVHPFFFRVPNVVHTLHTLVKTVVHSVLHDLRAALGKLSWV